MTTTTRVALTRIPDSWAWMAPDLLRRLLPFALVVAVVEIGWRPAWLGFSTGRPSAQIIFAAVAAPILFVAAAMVQLSLARRRGVLSVPSSGGDAWFQAAFYALNGPIEEAFFRGLVQGGLGIACGAPVGFIAGTATYVLYHRLGWPWAETLATALVGVPLGLAFWLLPGPPSLLGVSIAHIAATCGFLGPGPYLLKKLHLLSGAGPTTAANPDLGRPGSGAHRVRWFRARSGSAGDRGRVSCPRPGALEPRLGPRPGWSWRSTPRDAGRPLRPEAADRLRRRRVFDRQFRQRVCPVSGDAGGAPAHRRLLRSPGRRGGHRPDRRRGACRAPRPGGERARGAQRRRHRAHRHRLPGRRAPLALALPGGWNRIGGGSADLDAIA